MGCGNGKEPVDNPKQSEVVKQNKMPILLVGNELVRMIVHQFNAICELGFFIPEQTWKQVYQELIQVIIQARVWLNQAEWTCPDAYWLKRRASYFVYHVLISVYEDGHGFGLEMYSAISLSLCESFLVRAAVSI